MLTGRTGRRVSPAPGKRKQAAGYRTNRKDAGGAKGQAGLLRLVVCGSLFVLLVAVKLLLPGRMTELDRTLSAALNRNMDVKAVFAAVGELFTREGGAASASCFSSAVAPQSAGSLPPKYLLTMAVVRLTRLPRSLARSVLMV